MGALLHSLSLRHWLKHPVRAALTLIGVALGVAVTVAVQLIGDEILAAHGRTIASIAGKAQLIVTAGKAGLPRELTDRVAAVDGVAHVQPVIEEQLFEPARGPILLVAFDFLGDDALRQIEARADDEEVLDDPLAFLNSTRAILVAQGFAQRRGLTRGSTLELVTGRGLWPFEVKGIIKDEGPAKAFGGDVVIMDLDAAQVALGMDERISRIDSSVRDGAPLDEVQRNLQAALGPGFVVDPPARRGAKLDQMMMSLKQGLYMMAALAIWVGVLLAYNAVEISVRQRKSEIAILRAIGAERSHIVALILLESALMGVVATAIGLALGYLAARHGIGQTAATVSMVYQVVKIEGIHLGVPQVLIGVAVGVLVPVVAALRPARWIAYHPPAVGLGRAIEEIDVATGERRSWFAGLAMMAIGVVTFFLPQAQSQILVGYLAFSAVLLGTVFLGPTVVSQLAVWVHRFGGNRLPPQWVVALDHVVRDRRRAALNIASIVAGVATVVTVGTYVRSLNSANQAWLNSAVPADLFVVSGAPLAMSRNTLMDPSLGDALAQVPGVRDVYRVRLADQEHRGRPVKVNSVEIRGFLQHSKPLLLSGSADPDRLASGRYVLVGENTARREGYKPGDTVTLETPSGPKQFIVEGVVIDFTSDHGVFVVEREKFIEYWGDARIDSFDIFVDEPSRAIEVQQEIRKRFGAKYNLFVSTNREMKDEARKIIRQFFSLFDLLQLVTLMISVLGVSTTLIAAVIDRTQEIGIMRAVGSSAGQIIGIVLAEAAIIGGSATCIGLLCGTATGYLFLRSVLIAVVGWSLPWLIPASSYLPLLVGVTVASAIAALYPAVWSVRQPVLEAIRAD